MTKRVMIVVNVPEDNADAMRQAIGRAGVGKLGDYTYCSFSIKGKGRFMPGQNANPAIGKRGELVAVDEERIEVACNESDAPAIIRAIREAHPYEEPATVVYALLDLEVG